MSSVNILEYMSGMVSMSTYLKGVLVFSIVFYLGLFFIVDIWNDLQKGSGYTLISISYQIFVVSPASSDFVDLCPNLWCNNSRGIFFLVVLFCDFGFSFFFTKNVCFLCALCSNVTEFCSLSLKKTIQNPLLKRQIYP